VPRPASTRQHNQVDLAAVGVLHPPSRRAVPWLRRHVDHLIVRSLGIPYPNYVVYYADFPYNLTSAPEPEFVSAHSLKLWTWDSGIEDKSELIKGYRTQVDALFPTGRI